jgi:hypothetical protein
VLDIAVDLDRNRLARWIVVGICGLYTVYTVGLGLITG